MPVFLLSSRRPGAARFAALVATATLFFVGKGVDAQGLLDNLREAVGDSAQDSAVEKIALPERRANTEARIAELEVRLARAGAESQEPTALIAQLRVERALLERILMRQRQSEGVQAEIERLEAEQAHLEQELDTLLGSEVDAESGVSLAEVEVARDRLDDLREEGGLLQKAEVEAKRQLRVFETQATRARRAQLRASDEASRSGDPNEQAAARQTLRVRELETEELEESLVLKGLELEQARLRHENHSLLVSEQRERIRRLADASDFLEADFERITRSLDERDEDLKRQRDAADARIQGYSKEIDRIELEAQRVAEISEPMKKELEFYRFARELSIQRTQLIDRQDNRVLVLREAWNQRHQLAQGEVDASECSDWLAQVARDLEDLAFDEDSRVTALSRFREQLQEAQRQLEELGNNAAHFDRERTKLLGELVDAHEAVLLDIRATRRIVERLKDEIQQESSHVPFGQRLAVVRAWVADAWEYPLVSLGDDRAITVRKVVLGLTILILGGWLARRFSNLLSIWLSKRFKVSEGGLAVAQTLTFYLLLVLFFLLALKVVNVPLTAFTIFGGAIAIGVGFGSQNLINNFISGLILLLEQPVRVGDLIQVGDLQGNVERIGARSTVVRTGSNIEIVVPNSSFLEKDVVNWTLSESKVRVFVRVGVAYGSPTRDVAKFLKRAVDEHGRILKTPEPIVLFEDFGNDALIFEVHFWIRMRKVMDRRTIESDVRFIIDGLFRDAGITIAYPQRDIHLDTVRPLEVHVRADPAVKTSAETKE